MLLSFVAHFAAGGVLMRSYLGLLDGKFNSLTVVMAGEKGLNAPHVWLVMSGCFTALTMWKGFHFSNENLVQFPMIAQTGNTFFFLNDLFLYLASDTVFHPSGIIQNGRENFFKSHA